jgi:predicted nucleic acid-binding protein
MCSSRASSAATPRAPPALILDAWRTRLFTLVLSEPILTEVARALAKPYFAAYISPEEAAADLVLLRQQAEIVALTVRVSGVATHPADDLLLATAASAGVDYLVTGDGPFRRRVPTYKGVTLVSPREFLAILNPPARPGPPEQPSGSSRS